MTERICPHCSADLIGYGRVCRTCGREVRLIDQPLPIGRAAIPDTRSEAEIEAACIRVLELHRFRVWKLSQPRATKQSPGLPDCFFAGHGITGWAEFKRAGGKLRPEQETFRSVVLANGGRVCCWRDESEALAFCAGVTQRTESVMGSEERAG